MGVRSDAYTINDANEYTQVTRDSVAQNPVHDRAGNMTSFPTVPAIGASAGSTVSATAQWDAFNRLFTATVDPPSANFVEQYRCDPMGRRIARYEVGGTGLIDGDARRYIYDGWTVCEERTFDATATEANAPNTLERVYVNGRSIDEPLLAMIDGDTDRALTTNKNAPHDATGAPQTFDAEYYYFCNRMGTVHALLDADRDDRVLEYYRYEVYGSVTTLPIVDTGAAPGSTAADDLEDTPDDLTDNNAAVVAARTGGDAAAGRSSTFGNVYTFTARRVDSTTGLLYYRHRYYAADIGRFLTRDPISLEGTLTEYAFVANRTLQRSDPFGLFDPDDTLQALEKLDIRAYNKLMKLVRICNWKWGTEDAPDTKNTRAIARGDNNDINVDVDTSDVVSDAGSILDIAWKNDSWAFDCKNGIVWIDDINDNNAAKRLKNMLRLLKDPKEKKDCCCDKLWVKQQFSVARPRGVRPERLLSSTSFNRLAWQIRQLHLEKAAAQAEYFANAFGLSRGMPQVTDLWKLLKIAKSLSEMKTAGKTKDELEKEYKRLAKELKNK